MTAATKFLFDTRFDLEEESAEAAVDANEAETAPPAVTVEEPPPPPTFTEDELAEARAAAFAAGKAEGLSEAAAGIEARIGDSLNLVAERLSAILRTETEALEAAVGNAVEVALTVVRKLLPDLRERNALGEVDRLVRMALERVGGEQAIVIHVSTGLREALLTRLKGRPAGAGLGAKVTVLGSEELAPGDCRIEWPNGGANRDTSALAKEIDAIIEHHLGLAPGIAAAVGESPSGSATGKEDDTGGNADAG